MKRVVPAPGQMGFGLVTPKVKLDGYCSSCNVTIRDVFVHRSSEGHRIGRSSIRSSGPKGSVAYSPRKDAARQAYESLRRWDEQYDGDAVEDQDAEGVEGDWE